MKGHYAWNNNSLAGDEERRHVLGFEAELATNLLDMFFLSLSRDDHH